MTFARLLSILTLLVAGCVAVTGESTRSLAQAQDGGACSCAGTLADPLPAPTPLYGVSDDVLGRPSRLATWRKTPTSGNILDIGSSAVTLTDYKVSQLKLDADERIVMYLDGLLQMKLQDHPNGYLWAWGLGKVWFLNTLTVDAEIKYEGITSAGSATGRKLSMIGQNATGATGAQGGDVEICAGVGNLTGTGTKRGGDVLVRGGLSGATVTGSVALHREPTDPAYNGGRGVLYIGEATVPADDGPGSGGYLYVEGGALVYRGSAGTRTVIAPP